VTRRPYLLLAPLALALTALFHFDPLAAQTSITPSPEQLEMLRNLTPEQRDAILQQITGGSGSGSSSSSSRDRDRNIDRGERSDRETRNTTDTDTQRRDTDETQTLQPRIPLLKGDDTVIINIDVRKAEPGQEAYQYQYPNAYPNQQNPVVRPGVQPNLPPTIQQPGMPTQGNTIAPPPSRQSQRAAELTQDEIDRRKKLIELIRSRNPYRLTREGVLELPGFDPIPLAGLTEFQATVRLQSQRELRDLDVALILLPLKKIGREALKPFGYDLFDRAPSTFAPVTNVPVPADYIVGAGDELNVQLYGNQNRNLTLTVQRDGRINFPELGPINVTGQNFNSVKDTIEARVARQMIGVRASVSMGDTRAIRVFVLGEAKRPGSFTISGLGTITSALFAAGGVKPIGSLRSIQLKRQGQVVRMLDLYDMLIDGNTTDDAKLLPGDVVFIPPIGATVTVDGEVKRPAIYEMKPGSATTDAIRVAGGLTSEADQTKASLTRIGDNGNRSVLTVNPAAGQPVRNGDVLSVPRLRPTLDAGVQVEGYVHSPAIYAYREGLRLTDVIRSVDDLRPNADLHYVLVRRENPPNRDITAVSADLAAALRNPGSAADIILMPRDRITVFDLEPSRERIIRPLLEELRLQANSSAPTEVVSVDGRVKAPGDYPLEPGMRVSDLVRAGGNLQDGAYGGKAELTRYSVINGDSRRTQHIEIDLAAALQGDAAANVLLAPFDSLSIKEVPDWGAQEHVTLVGEVRFPGRYSIRRGETLRSVLTRAGGLTEYAFPEGSVFTRDELKEREQKELDMLADRMQNDLVTLALQGAAAANQAQAGSALTIGQSLLAQIRSSEAVGRLVIDLPRAMRGGGGVDSDIILRDGDRLMVPKFQQEVTVIGEVQTSTSHLYRPELGRDDYIALSGGVSRRADKAKIYVVRADGSVVANEGGRWFSRSSIDIRPGDTVVVPLDTERLPALPFWQAVTQIIYNLAISAAAVHSF
jgi:polysaccharide biosynthesis/export protein